MSESYLPHYGVKGMKWGVRRYQNKDGSLTAAGKKRRNKKPGERVDAPKVTTTSTAWGSRRVLEYTNKANTAEKAELDKIADDYDFDEAYKFDDELAKYAENLKRGKEYADKILHDKLKNYSYYLATDTEIVDEGETYTTYWLEVSGNKSYYSVAGDGDYFDDQSFGPVY